MKRTTLGDYSQINKYNLRISCLFHIYLLIDRLTIFFITHTYIYIYIYICMRPSCVETGGRSNMADGKSRFQHDQLHETLHAFRNERRVEWVDGRILTSNKIDRSIY